MNSFIIVSVAVVVVSPIVLALLFRKRRKAARCMYQTNPMLFGTDERALYVALREAIGDEFAIFGKIRVGEIIQLPRDGERRDPPDSYEALAERCFSFVLCHPVDLSVIAGIELKEEARTAQRPSVHDNLLQALCTAAGFPLVVIQARQCHDREELREIVMEALRQQPLPVPHGDGRKEPHISSIRGLKLE